MKLTSFVLLVILLQLQPKVFRKKITYVKRGVELLQVFKEIKKQTGFSAIWNEKAINVDRRINVNFKNSGIENVMKELTEKLNIDCTISKKFIILTIKE